MQRDGGDNAWGNQATQRDLQPAFVLATRPALSRRFAYRSPDMLLLLPLPLFPHRPLFTMPCPLWPAAFRYSSHLTPRRLLTKPAEPTGNSGWDNATHDLIVAVGDEFVSTLGSRWGGWLDAGAGDAQPFPLLRQSDPDADCPHRCGAAALVIHLPLLPPAVVCRYVVRDLLGQGTFGQVFKCVCTDSVAAGGEEQEGDIIAIKVGEVVQEAGCLLASLLRGCSAALPTFFGCLPGSSAAPAAAHNLCASLLGVLPAICLASGTAAPSTATACPALLTCLLPGVLLLPTHRL
jgi:hypothetical protein